MVDGEVVVIHEGRTNFSELQAGCSAHVVHCSVGRGYELCESYRRQGFDATVEACIHYLILDEENDVARLGGKAKINPPIRPRAQVEALWRHLAAGHVTVVSTDHISWSEDRKTDPNMLKNASGVPGLEVLCALLLKGLPNVIWTLVTRRGCSLPIRCDCFALAIARVRSSPAATPISLSWRTTLVATIRAPAATTSWVGAPGRHRTCASISVINFRCFS